MPWPLAVAMIAAAVLSLPSRAMADEPTQATWQITPGTRLALTTAAEGSRLFAVADSFVEKLSRFDLQSRLKSAQPVTRNAYLAFVAQQTRSFTYAETTTLQTAASDLKKQLSDFDLPLPSVVHIIKTTGAEEAGAAYCRGNCVCLPHNMLDGSAEETQQLLIHELFHILSSHAPELRRKLYAIIGFTPIPPLEIPPDLAPRIITNPDGHRYDYCIHIAHDGQRLPFVPILIAKRDYDADTGDSFFPYMQFRLLAIQIEEKRSVAISTSDKLSSILIDPDRTPDFFEQIGRNTSYVIHPDEILADNFVHLVNKKDNLPNPEIVEKMRELLRK